MEDLNEHNEDELFRLMGDANELPAVISPTTARNWQQSTPAVKSVKTLADFVRQRRQPQAAIS